MLPSGFSELVYDRIRFCMNWESQHVSFVYLSCVLWCYVHSNTMFLWTIRFARWYPRPGIILKWESHHLGWILFRISISVATSLNIYFTSTELLYTFELGNGIGGREGLKISCRFIGRAKQPSIAVGWIKWWKIPQPC